MDVTGAMPLLWALGAIAGPGYFVLLLLRTPFRRRALRELAARHGWTFTKRDDQGWPARFGSIPCLAGHGGTAYHVIAGRHRGMDFTLCTYQWHTGSGDDEAYHIQRVLVVPTPVSAPGLHIEPETTGMRLAGATRGDIDFESDAFSRRFLVACADRRFASDCIDPAVMEWLLANDLGWTWDWDGHHLVLHIRGLFLAKHVIPALDLAQGFVARLPRLVKAGHAGTPTGAA